MKQPSEAFLQRALRRHHGFEGGLIVRHRSLRSLDMRLARCILTLVVSLGLTVLWLASVNWTFAAWAGLQTQLMRAFGVDGSVELATRPVVAGYELYVPQILISVPAVTREILWIATIVSALVLAGSWLIPR
jgi:hypothetical protein